MFARTIVTSVDKWVGTVGLTSFIGSYVTPWDQILSAATIFYGAPRHSIPFSAALLHRRSGCRGRERVVGHEFCIIR